MKIYFKTKKLAKVLNDSNSINRVYGNSAKKIKQRLDDLAMVDNLEEAMQLPGRHHPLTGDRKGQFACDLEHPFRLIYQPANEPLPIDEKNTLIYKEITIIEIIEITDYH
ncbi:MAG: toxin HigB [Tenuifilum sp.]|jgi:proteic killer suppression protein|uniref:type II toxin-antitoxin system RelE/ParE family toxin n=1 Tax=Tenuifilum sp. TaxID=2760880 RepID=UPI0024AA6B51|nr:killer suppression protein HigA [Tenuifilum sp.]MDI3527424.1 toxin HigB [Tenuifilum sp.]